jgi:hypothetical protein
VKVIFTGIGILLAAAKNAHSSQDNLLNIFERIEIFFRRLDIYTMVPPTTEMMEIFMKIIVEVLCILAIATKEIKQGRMKKYMKRLVGRTDMEDALNRLDKLTREEAWMASAESLRATHAIADRVAETEIDSRVRTSDDKVATVVDSTRTILTRSPRKYLTLIYLDGTERREATQQSASNVEQLEPHTCTLAEYQLPVGEKIHGWLSPPDPSTNHDIACGTHHKRTATWFFQGSIFGEWMSTASLLWIHGKRTSFPTTHPTLSDDVLYSKLARARAFSVPPSSKMSKPCARLDVPR